MKTFWTFILLAVCTCQGATTEPTVWTGAGAKRFLHLMAGGAFSSYWFYTIADDKFLFERFDPEKPHAHKTVLAAQKLLTLSSSDAAELWAKIDSLQIDRWNQRYDPKDLGVEVFDGTTWRVLLRRDGKEKRSSGFNVYPAALPLGQPTLSVDEHGKSVRSAFHSLIEVLDDLSKNANKAPEPTP